MQIGKKPTPQSAIVYKVLGMRLAMLSCCHGRFVEAARETEAVEDEVQAEYEVVKPTASTSDVQHALPTFLDCIDRC
jgi:hypothetical protein